MKQKKLIIRSAELSDLEAIRELSQRVYGEEWCYSVAALRAQITHFPSGQFLAEYDNKVIGYCASIMVAERKALHPHTWREITADGYGSTHDPKGEYLYGIEIFVDPDFRRLRIGQRFYAKRFQLCRELGLKGVIFAGRMPLLEKRIKKVGSVENYLEAVKNKDIRDPIISFQLRNGFEILGVLKDYLPRDKESLGYAAHMIWKNPDDIFHEDTARRNIPRLEKDVRVAIVQYMQRGINSFEEFSRIVEYFVDVVSNYKGDFALFPELFTLQLLSIENEHIRPDQAIDKLTAYTEPIKELFTRLAIRYNVNIIGGSHPTRVSESEIMNISYVYLRDGSVHEQRKIHPTPNERYWWNMKGGSQVSVIDTDCGPIGVLICYDSEFPELARRLVDQGVNIIFIPFCTDEKQSYLRVRYCAQARAVENQVYVAMAGNVGNLPRVENMDIQYAQSCILTPCDFYFARDGIAADTTPNVEMVSFADLNINKLYHARLQGTVLNLKDRRHDLYSVVWHKRT